jgi:hypothetical protein
VAAFAALALSLGIAGAVPAAELLWAAASVAAAFLPTAWIAPGGWRRRAAELALLLPALALALVADPTMRRMVVPPLLVLAALAAVGAAMRTAPAARLPHLAVGLVLAGRLAGGLGLAGAPWLAVVVAVAAPAAVAWLATAAAGRHIGTAVSLAVLALPLQRSPLWAVMLVAVAVLAAPSLRPLARGGERGGWLVPALAIALVGSACSAWGGLRPALALPAAGLLAAAAAAAAAVATARAPAALAGAVWVAATFAFGPAQPPPPDRAGFQLTPAAPSVTLPVSDGRAYVVELSLANAAALAADTPVAALSVGDRTLALRAGVDTAEWAHERADVRAIVAHPLPANPVWRPGGVGAEAFWGVAGRTVLAVPAGVAPVLTRQVPASVGVAVATAGPARPTPPRSWSLLAWVLAGALAVAAVQLAARTFSGAAAALPWALLATASVVARMPVEPLRLILERHGPDVALAALVLAWLPAARVWFAARRHFLAAAMLLTPIALATPHLTPPMYGDEPFHLVVLSSLAQDWDLDLANNLDLEHQPYNRIYMSGKIFLHSPVLGVLLLPGFAVLGRSGALALLALAGAGVVAFVCRRAETLGVPRARVSLLATALLLGYPLATFSSQVWVEVPGALATAAGLALLAAAPRRRGAIAAAAVLAGAMKLRLALTSLPLAALAWWPAGGDRRARARALAAVAAMAAAVLATAWVFLGGPLGLRRLGDLVPKRLAQPFIVVGGLLFDPAGGLAFTAPLLVLSLAGLGLLWRRGGAGERAVLLGGAATVLALLHSLEWYGGGAPPARYLVPLLPAFALAGALLLRFAPRWRSAAALAVPPTLLSWAVLLARPHFSINPGDGGWWLADALARRYAAGARHLFPSFLAPSPATWIVPAALLAAAAALALLARRAAAARTLGRVAVAVWLLVAALVVTLVTRRLDGVVEIEEPQVERLGGVIEPPEGTFSRFLQPNGWRIADGDGVVVPLNLAAGDTVTLAGWIDGAAQRGAWLRVRWDDGSTTEIGISGGGRASGQLPSPPGAGRRRLHVGLRSPAGGSVVLDRVVVSR